MIWLRSRFEVEPYDTDPVFKNRQDPYLVIEIRSDPYPFLKYSQIWTWFSKSSRIQIRSENQDTSKIDYFLQYLLTKV